MGSEEIDPQGCYTIIYKVYSLAYSCCAAQCKHQVGCRNRANYHVQAFLLLLDLSHKCMATTRDAKTCKHAPQRNYKAIFSPITYRKSHNIHKINKGKSRPYTLNIYSGFNEMLLHRKALIGISLSWHDEACVTIGLSLFRKSAFGSSDSWDKQSIAFNTNWWFTEVLSSWMAR